jgi:hypothetical protein
MRQLIPYQLGILQDLIYLLESGYSLRDSLLQILESNPKNEFILKIQLWIKQHDAGLGFEDFAQILTSPIDRKIFSLLERGLIGEPILKYLIQLEHEIQELIRIKRDRNLAVLPIKLLIPLILMIFPAYLIVLLIPILSELGSLLK